MSRIPAAHGPTRSVVPLMLGSLVLLLAGCAGGQEADDPAAAFDPGMGHVHGLGVDPASGDVLAATHTGLFRLGDGDPVRVADRWQDTMGFTVDGDRLLGSGHPDLREDLPVHLGLIESTDTGRTWTALSLEGEADLHALTVDSGSSDVFAWDSVSGAVLASADGGRTWQEGQTFEAVADLVVDPDGTSLLATTAEGLLASTDRGTTFAASVPQPPVLLSQVEPLSTAGSSGGLAGVAVDGSVWHLTAGDWTQVGALPGAPAAFTVTPDGNQLAATEDEILRSGDDGRTWEQLTPLGAGDRS